MYTVSPYFSGNLPNPFHSSTSMPEEIFFNVPRRVKSQNRLFSKAHLDWNRGCARCFLQVSRVIFHWWPWNEISVLFWRLDNHLSLNTLDIVLFAMFPRRQAFSRQVPWAYLNWGVYLSRDTSHQSNHLHPQGELEVFSVYRLISGRVIIFCSGTCLGLNKVFRDWNLHTWCNLQYRITSP